MLFQDKAALYKEGYDYGLRKVGLQREKDGVELAVQVLFPNQVIREKLGGHHEPTPSLACKHKFRHN